MNPRDQNFVAKVMENLTKADSHLLPGFGAGEGIVSGQTVRFPLVVKFDFDKELQTTVLGEEDFLAALSAWEKSEKASVAKKGLKMEEELQEADSET